MKRHDRSPRCHILMMLFVSFSMVFLSARSNAAAEAIPNPGKSSCKLKPVFSNEKLKEITDLVSFDNAYYVVQRRGVISRVSSTGYRVDYNLLNMKEEVESSGFEQGLLGLAFPPQATSDKRFFIYYTRKDDNAVTISEIQKESDDAFSERILLTVGQPYTNHNGGYLAFGADGFLYAGIGDGGSGGDPHKYGQDRNTLLGTLIRINPDKGGDLEYQIPEDNPFVGHPTFRGEIFAYGLRNPWRMDFADDGSIFIADVGQNRWEEVSRARKGDNLGWSFQEGFACFIPANCKKKGLRQPLFVYGRSEGISITGGKVYRGKLMKELQGAFVFGDFGSGKIWGLRERKGKAEATLLLESGLSISTFGTLVDGEPAVVDYFKGSVHTFSCDKISFSS